MPRSTSLRPFPFVGEAHVLEGQPPGLVRHGPGLGGHGHLGLPVQDAVDPVQAGLGHLDLAVELGQAPDGVVEAVEGKDVGEEARTVHGSPTRIWVVA